MKTIVTLLLLALAACSTTATSLTYSATGGTRAASPGVGTVSVIDARDEKDPTYIGAIRGAYGNPLKTLVSRRPIREEVQQTFEAALHARNMLGSGAPLSLAVTLKDLSANQYNGRNAKVAFTLALSSSGGRMVYSDAVAIERKNGGFFSFDNAIFASTDDLRAFMDKTLTEAIDQALDKPGFATAAGSPPN